MHMLIIIQHDDEPQNTDDYDNNICAEIPDLDADPELYETITSANIHSSCGPGIPNRPCMDITQEILTQFTEKGKMGATLNRKNSFMIIDVDHSIQSIRIKKIKCLYQH